MHLTLVMPTKLERGSGRPGLPVLTVSYRRHLGCGSHISGTALGSGRRQLGMSFSDLPYPCTACLSLRQLQGGVGSREKTCLSLERQNLS
jgi:hypothetical protein